MVRLLSSGLIPFFVFHSPIDESPVSFEPKSVTLTEFEEMLPAPSLTSQNLSLWFSKDWSLNIFNAKKGQLVRTFLEKESAEEFGIGRSVEKENT